MMVTMKVMISISMKSKINTKTVLTNCRIDMIMLTILERKLGYLKYFYEDDHNDDDDDIKCEDKHTHIHIL